MRDDLVLLYRRTGIAGAMIAPDAALNGTTALLLPIAAQNLAVLRLVRLQKRLLRGLVPRMFSLSISLGAATKISPMFFRSSHCDDR